MICIQLNCFKIFYLTSILFDDSQLFAQNHMVLSIHIQYK